MGIKETFNQGIDKGYATIGKFVSYASTNKDKVIKSIANALLLFVIFAVFGCFDFLTMSFRFEYLLQVSYWTKVVAKAIAGGICAYNIGINLSWDSELKKDVVLEENAKKYERLNKTRDEKTFNDFVVNVFNRKQKIKAYKNKMNAKIYRLNRFARNKDKLLYSSDKESDIELKKTNKYCIKRKELENLMSDEYIEKNIDNLNVKYHYVDPIAFNLELDGKTRYKGVVVTGSASNERVKATANGLMSMVVISAFITSIGLSANQQQFESQMVAFWHYLLTCAEDVGIIIWKTLQGIFASRKIISNGITKPLVGRNQVLTEYNEWCVENKIEKSKSYQIYKGLVESENKLNETMAN